MIRNVYVLITFLLCSVSHAQLSSPALTGYWHNWNDSGAPYIQLTDIDTRYDVVEVAFAVPVSPSDMTMKFEPDMVSVSTFVEQVQALQKMGKKVLISIGGATASIDLTTEQNKNAFSGSILSILNTFNFDGIDIDIEHGNSILITSGTISEPTNIAQLHLIEAIRQIMLEYRTTHNKKLLLTMAPETAYVQGGQSGFGGIWGGYLPIIHALRDSIDVLQVQLYNSGTMYGIDGNIYSQGTSDFIVAMTEAVIQGFNTSGGMFEGLPPAKIAVGLPACPSASGGGFADTATVKAAMDYLRGTGPQPGSYVLVQADGYPGLRGMMTWSINWDAEPGCGGAYQFANNYQVIFDLTSDIAAAQAMGVPLMFPNPTNGSFTVNLPAGPSEIIIVDVLGNQVLRMNTAQQSEQLQLERSGLYFVYLLTDNTVLVNKLIVSH